ncbi:hypothetical protein [Nonomuraea africana]|uniref:hypothetical protein n=1 Tax=Nonomuraea africana TaxID=46171 RepID=UPI0033C12984
MLAERRPAPARAPAADTANGTTAENAAAISRGRLSSRLMRASSARPATAPTASTASGQTSWSGYVIMVPSARK